MVFFLLHCGHFVHTQRAGGHLHPLDGKKQKRGLPPAGAVGQACKPNMPWCMELSLPGYTLASVWRVHGALSPLLLLLLLHQQLLQSRRARMHHGTGPDRLKNSPEMVSRVQMPGCLKGLIFQSQPNIKAQYPKIPTP